MGSERPLRTGDWVEATLRKVTEATKGRLAYVSVPDTADTGHTYFKRYFFPQADREAIIVDERHNGGGGVAEHYNHIPRRPVVTHWAIRYGAAIKTTTAGAHGPKARMPAESPGPAGAPL